MCIRDSYQIKGQSQSRKRPQADDSDDMDTSNAFKADDVPTISKRNERKVWATIKSTCEEALSRYPHTLEEDMEILKRTDLTFNERNCTLFRSGEKEILHFLVDMAEFLDKLLDMKFKDAKKITQTLPPRMESCRDYIQNYVMRLIAADKNQE